MNLQVNNTSATYAMWSGIGTWVVNCMGCCLGLVPVLNLLTIPMGLLSFVMSVAAVFLGFKGRQVAAQTGVGGGEAMAGLLLGAANLALSAVMLVALFAMGGLALLGGLMQQ